MTLLICVPDFVIGRRSSGSLPYLLYSGLNMLRCVDIIPIDSTNA